VVVHQGQQQAVLVVETAASEPLGLGYGALRRRELAVEEDQVPSTFEVGQSSRSVPEQQGAERLMQRELKEMRGRVAALEQERGRREP
ncbi:hypothetical protein Tco_0301044, partial [Tanacetum coccineum]